MLQTTHVNKYFSEGNNLVEINNDVSINIVVI